MSSERLNSHRNFSPGDSRASRIFDLYRRTPEESDVVCYLRWWLAGSHAEQQQKNHFVDINPYTADEYIKVLTRYTLPEKKEKLFFKVNRKAKIGILKEHVIRIGAKKCGNEPFFLKYLIGTKWFNEFVTRSLIGEFYPLTWDRRLKKHAHKIARCYSAILHFVAER